MRKKPSKISNDPVAVIGKILNINGTPTEDGYYVPESTTYDIRMVKPDGGVILLQRQSPQVRLWASPAVIDASRLLLSSCMGVMIANEVRWFIYEPVGTTECDSNRPAFSRNVPPLSPDGGRTDAADTSTPTDPSTPTSPPTGDSVSNVGES